MNLVDQLNHVAHKTRVKKELSYYVLHILTLKATAQYKHDTLQKAQQTYLQVSYLYERWRTNKYQEPLAQMSEVHQKNIFGTEEYIQARAMCAECLQIMGNLHDAIEHYELIKRDMETLIIFEDSVLYINVCNQLGNCYYKINDLDRALENL